MLLISKNLFNKGKITGFSVKAVECCFVHVVFKDHVVPVAAQGSCVISRIPQTITEF